ncbi:hypothetical protein [Streptomyces diastaticus]|uniref:hypothetical protein n=1 Tax=Streptomyces diastaticus TaxID=1956 RepID=UPI00365846FB
MAGSCDQRGGNFASVETLDVEHPVGLPAYLSPSSETARSAEQQHTYERDRRLSVHEGGLLYITRPRAEG